MSLHSKWTLGRAEGNGAVIDRIAKLFARLGGVRQRPGTFMAHLRSIHGAQKRHGHDGEHHVDRPFTSCQKVWFKCAWVVVRSADK